MCGGAELENVGDLIMETPSLGLKSGVKATFKTSSEIQPEIVCKVRGIWWGATAPPLDPEKHPSYFREVVKKQKTQLQASFACLVVIVVAVAGVTWRWAL